MPRSPLAPLRGLVQLGLHIGEPALESGPKHGRACGRNGCRTTDQRDQIVSEIERSLLAPKGDLRSLLHSVHGDNEYQRYALPSTPLDSPVILRSSMSPDALETQPFPHPLGERVLGQLDGLGRSGGLASHCLDDGTGR